MTNKDQITRKIWTAVSYLFFGLGLWFFVYFLLFAEYEPTLDRRDLPRVWEVLWEFRGLVIVPAPFVLLGLFFRRLANANKSRQ